jgi:RNA polymerase sigma-70 factor (ECF subfamily)
VSSLPGIPASLVHDLWLTAEAAACDLTPAEFSSALGAVGVRLNYGLPAGTHPDAAQRAGFLRGLRLAELALATACALGRETAWRRFFALYRAPLTQAAIAITGSATLGHDLADSLYSELYGLRQVDGERRSPLSSYSGRGSLLGWLRTTLAQRHVDHHRRTHREAPLDSFDAPSPVPEPAPVAGVLAHLSHALSRTLEAVAPEDRFLLSAYFLDRQTLLHIARLLHVHEATISRRLKRLVAQLRKQLLRNLQSGGLSRIAAEEALGIDPRDIEINLRSLLQISQIAPFQNQGPTESVSPAPDPS